MTQQNIYKGVIFFTLDEWEVLLYTILPSLLYIHIKKFKKNLKKKPLSMEFVEHNRSKS